MISAIIIVGILFVFVYGVFIVLETIDDKIIRHIELLRKQKAQCAKDDTKVEKVKKPNLEPVYQFQTHRMRYLLYNPRWDLEYLAPLYKDVVLEYLWINEPFHSKFYEMLMILDQNEFMIIDSNSKIITMSVRDANNQANISKSYQVFATKDIVETTIRESMRNIMKFQKRDAQNILLAICIMALEQSIHYASKEVAENIIKELLKDYAYNNTIEFLINLIKKKEEELLFIEYAFKEAFETARAWPYNDSETSKPLRLPKELPIKYLQEI